ncbi:glycosyltransferase [Mycoplasma procyoni]|uniref:glycosyltransferase n=1 Tax=Mycoplasma procyoni TaxID=568784 RepID=UPI00197B6A23|nr:glycosyltransferase [Mycoplasma procyoni]MBN3534557.1 glycosyltransferase [Mycoplasma procyoni]
MKLSIVIPSYKQKNELKSVLDSCIAQKKQDFEIILNLTKPTNEELKLIENYKEIFKDKLKVIFTTKRQGVVNNIETMLKIAEGDYFIVVFPETNLKDFFVAKFLETAKKFKTDIIEFRPQFKGFFKLEPHKRLEDSKIFKIQENKEVVAYTFPLIFNKFFKTEKFKEIAQARNYRDANNKFLIDLLYKTIISFDTFVYIDEVIINEWNNNIPISNPMQILRDWSEIDQFTTENFPNFKAEIQYAKLYQLEVFFPAILGLTKVSLLQRILKHEEKFSPLVLKYYDKLKEIRKAEFNLWTTINRYILQNCEESKLIIQSFSPSKWITLHKKI